MGDQEVSSPGDGPTFVSEPGASLWRAMARDCFDEYSDEMQIYDDATVELSDDHVWVSAYLCVPFDFADGHCLGGATLEVSTRIWCDVTLPSVNGESQEPRRMEFRVPPGASKHEIVRLVQELAPGAAVTVVPRQKLAATPPAPTPPAAAQWDEVLQKVDWALLREQKQALLDVTHDGKPLMGIVHLLDSLQDAAALSFGETAVFGYPSARDDEADDSEDSE